MIQTFDNSQDFAARMNKLELSFTVYSSLGSGDIFNIYTHIVVGWWYELMGKIYVSFPGALLPASVRGKKFNPLDLRVKGSLPEWLVNYMVLDGGHRGRFMAKEVIYNHHWVVRV